MSGGQTTSTIERLSRIHAWRMPTYLSSILSKPQSQRLTISPKDVVKGMGFESERVGITFGDVGGMDDVKEHLRMNIILPLQKPELFRAYGKRVGGGILMYGPPGCGKTYL